MMRTLLYYDATHLRSVTLRREGEDIAGFKSLERKKGEGLREALVRWAEDAAHDNLLGGEIVVTAGTSEQQGIIARYALEREGKASIISPEEEREVVQRARDRMQDEARKKLLQEKGILPEDWRLLRVVVGDAQVDGYPVRRLRGYRGKKIEIGALGVFLRERTAQDILAAFSGYGVAVTGRHIAEGIARRLHGNGLFVEISAEHTRLALVRGGRIEKVSSAPMGSGTFARLISSSFGIEEHGGRTMIERHANEDLPEEQSEKIRTLLLPKAEHFATLCVAYFADAAGVLRIFGPGSRIPEVVDAFKTRVRTETLLPEEVMPSWKGVALSPEYTSLAFL